MKCRTSNGRMSRLRSSPVNGSRSPGARGGRSARTSSERAASRGSATSVVRATASRVARCRALRLAAGDMAVHGRTRWSRWQDSRAMDLPDGIRIGHWSDFEGYTGCTVVLPPEGTVAAGEVRGGGPGTRESDLLSPAANAPGVQAVCFAGGSAYGLAAADGVVSWLDERGVGYSTPAGIVPLVAGAIVYDLPLGDSKARPGAAAGRAACEAAGREVERGTVGAGTGASVGKVLGHDHWTKGGVGLAGDQ